MDPRRFDALARATTTITTGASRRALIGVVLAAALPAGVAAKRGKKKKKIKRNAFGCVSDGGFCNGQDSLCCSGLCQGPKQKSTCRPHDEGGCARGDDICANDLTPCETASGDFGVCHTTTGRSGYCGAVLECHPCSRDVECETLCGAGAACVACTECPAGTACTGFGACQL